MFLNFNVEYEYCTGDEIIVVALLLYAFSQLIVGMV